MAVFQERLPPGNQRFVTKHLSDMINPKISVVTVSFNTHDIIEKTLQSVTAQDYKNLEYIVIDGGSTDHAQDIIEQYTDKIAYYVSEHDGGIYYGMNKGIDAATGQWLLFMNAGDIFADSHVVTDIADFINCHPEADVVYGNSMQVLEYGTYVVKPKEAYMNNRMSISHQATFVKLDLLKSHKFDTRYRYAADFEQLSHFYLSGYKFVYCDRLVATVEMTDGATYRHFIESANEMYDIIESRGINISRERRSQIRRKKIIRAVRNTLPLCIRKPLFRFLAEHYKAL